MKDIVRQAFLAALFYEDPPPPPPPPPYPFPLYSLTLFLNFVQTPLPTLFAAFFLWLNVTSATSNVLVLVWYYRLKLVEPCYLCTSGNMLCVLCNKASNLLKVWHKLLSFCQHSDLISKTQTNTQTTQIPIDWNKYKKLVTT